MLIKDLTLNMELRLNDIAYVTRGIEGVFRVTCKISASYLLWFGLHVVMDGHVTKGLDPEHYNILNLTP